MSVPLDKHIVIVGGGYAGVKLAMHLKKHEANFTLIDAKDSFVHNVANVRAIVQPGMESVLWLNSNRVSHFFCLSSSMC